MTIYKTLWNLLIVLVDENAEYDPHRKLSYKEMRARDGRRFEVMYILKFAT